MNAFQGYSDVLQQTIRSRVHCSGVGLHCGTEVTMALIPAEADSGIVFVRTDLAGAPAIAARWDRVADTRMCTTLANPDGVSVATVEHLMAALAGLAIDNVIVEIDGPEVPVMDGSAAPFVFLIECAGMTELEAPRRALRVLAPVTVDGRGWSASLEPDDGFSIAVDIDFPGTAVSHQSLSVPIADGVFKRDLARARTFGFLNEVEELRAAGLARGGSLDNVVVIDGERIVNDGGLRFEDEFVRHKALDALGDLYLAGGPLLGRFRGMRTGHAANNRLLRALFARKDAWRWESLTGDAPSGAGAIAAPWSRPCAAVAGL